MARPKGQPKIGGRQKGTPNKLNKTVKEMIVQALHKSGGVDYLVQQAQLSPAAFLSLVGKIVPTELQSTALTQIGEALTDIINRAQGKGVSSLIKRE